MNKRLAKIMVFISAALMLLVSAYAEARTSVSGEAELSYVNYDAKAANPATGSQARSSGESFSQRYMVDYNISNLNHRNQAQYYDLSLGYEWMSFDTKISDDLSDSHIKGVLGKFRYSGDVAYNPSHLPLSLRITANDADPTGFNRFGNDNNSGLVGSNLINSIYGDVKNAKYTVSFAFDPRRASKNSLRGLPTLNLDYRETFLKSTTGNYIYDNSTKELAVAGLNKENNWIHFRTVIYEDYIDSHNNFNSQQFQIGLVDYNRRRLWSSLTNWIDVSADGQLATRKGTTNSEEYDVNFMAIATRRTWSARSFMNYNRLMIVDTLGSENKLTEQARVPVYIKGIYGAETDWYFSVTAERGTQTDFQRGNLKENSYLNQVTLGLNAFKRSKFTFSPSLSVLASKGYGGADVLELTAGAEAASTARFSNKLGLFAKGMFRYKNDGLNLPSSDTWSSTLNLRADYKTDSRFVSSFREELAAGTDVSQDHFSPLSGPEKYVRTYTLASIAWTPKASFTTSLEASYDLRMNETSADTKEAMLLHRLSYDKQSTLYRLETQFIERSSNTGNILTFTNTGDFQYRPDRYNDLTLKYSYKKTNENSFMNTSEWSFIQKYNYSFFTRTGILRNYATLGQELGYTGTDTYGSNASYKYLRFSGRYSPTDKISLFGSAKYEKANTGSTVLYYTAGLNADFKLLTTSIDYTLAKRDSDKRTERRLAATVKRSF